jgi:Tfp pilus assembly protein FimT
MTLLEVLLVVIIVAIVAATAVPSFSSAAQAQTSASVYTAQTLLTTARTRAASEGRPYGVRFVNRTGAGTQDNMWMVVVEAANASVTGARSALGVASASTDPESIFPGSLIVSMTGGSATDETVWFDQIGRPHTRTPAGAFSAEWTADREIVFASGNSLVVRRLTGAVEVQ